jgi:hypothetical protein
VELFLDVKTVQSGTERMEFGLFAKSAGTEQTPQDNVSNLTLSLKTHADIELSG